MTRRRLWRAALAVAALLPVAPRAYAQRTEVSGTVRAVTGEALESARVRATIGALDTVVRTGSRGTYAIALPSGNVTLRVTSIGYAETVRNIVTAGTPLVVDIALTRNAQELGKVEVNARWTGIRGVIADDSTRLPIVGATVSTAHRNRLVTTDSNGRFALELPAAEHTVLEISHAGYHTRVKGVDITADRATLVVQFLTPGNDSDATRQAIADLDRRLALGQFYSFTTSALEVTKNGGKTVNDALYASGLLMRNGLRLGDSVCVFVDGTPKYGLSASRIDVDNVDFLEVYSADPNGTLANLWGKFSCPPVLGNPHVGNGKFVGWIVVWTKK